MKKKIFTLLAATLMGGSAVASGFQVLLQGNRETAMGNVGVGLRPAASSIFFNPGAISMMKENGVSVGVSGIFANNSYYASDLENSTYTSKTDNPMGTPFHLYGAFGAEDSNLKFGLGVYTPYGSQVDWEEGWRGEQLLDEITLQAIFVQPTISYRINDKLSIGAGFVYMFGSVNLQRSLPIASAQGQSSLELDGSANGYGYNLGVYFMPTDKLTLGFNYRSKVDAKVEGGDAIFHNIPAAAMGQFQADKFDAKLPLPSNTTLGAAYMPSDRLTVSAEVSVVGWSAYESLTFDFNGEVNGSRSSSSPRNYEDAWVFRLGGEYMATTDLAVRAGIYYDQTPVQEGYMTPETPDSDRLGLTAGLGYNVSDRFGVDLSFLYIHGMEREQTVAEAEAAGTLVNPNPATGTAGSQDVLPGKYKLNAFIPGISLSYKF